MVGRSSKNLLPMIRMAFGILADAALRGGAARSVP
jgi:hypothetical protein